MRYIWTLLILLAQAAATAAQPAEPPQRDSGFADRLRQHAARMMQTFYQLGDWETHRVYLLEAVDKVYERNGWTSEPDAFSLALIHEANAIPPWQPQERFDRAMDMLRQRYGLDDRQEQMLRVAFSQQSMELFQEHSWRIMQYAGEAIQTRAAGQPFTPEQVARWVRTAEPVFLDSRQRMNAMAQRLMPELSPPQREIVQHDLEALNCRLDKLHALGERWADGQWQPSDWGMETDPIQLGAAAGSAEPQPWTAAPGVDAGGGGAAEVGSSEAARAGAGRQVSPVRRAPQDFSRPDPSRPAADASQPKDDDPWAEYVRRFIAKYNLDETQQATAWRVYRNLKNQADRHRARCEQKLEALGQRGRATGDERRLEALREAQEQLRAELDKLFGQLKQRLDRLPTRAQRANAGPEDLDKPSEPRVRKPVNPNEHDGP